MQTIFANMKVAIMTSPDIPFFRGFQYDWKNIDLKNLEYILLFIKLQDS